MSEPTARLRPNGVVTLTTDFGTGDGYVGAMKGVILGVELGLRIHDLAHDVEPQAVAHGALVLRDACGWFPPGTVHVAVVDPGVGTERAALVVVAGGHAFVGPDNGLFTFAVDHLGGPAGAWRIDPEGPARIYCPAKISATFHGRDLFAPVGAALAAGLIEPSAAGPETSPVILPGAGPPRRAGGTLIATVVYCDRFGNAVTNVDSVALSELPPGDRRVRLPSGVTAPMLETYGAAGDGDTLALIGSGGFLEVAVRDGSALEALSLSPGDEVRIEAVSRFSTRDA